MKTQLATVMSALLLATTFGCARSGDAGPAADTTGEATANTSAEHNHGGWWCDEHGVPEAECGQCDAKLAAAFQKRGDWCKEHDRPDSQCFVCHPELEATFAARYEARTGKQPPKPGG
jgi:hypothetical protein